MAFEKNRRNFSRSQVSLEATLFIDGCLAESCEADNVSLGGVFLHTKATYSLDALCRVVIVFNDQSEKTIEVHGRIARMNDSGIGIDIETVVSAESLEHLQSLVLYNSDEPRDAIVEILNYQDIKEKRQVKK